MPRYRRPYNPLPQPVWNDLYPLWLATMRERGVDPEELFAVATVCDLHATRDPGERSLHWAPAGKEDDFRFNSQHWLYYTSPSSEERRLAAENDGLRLRERRYADPPQGEWKLSMSEIETLSDLWELRGKPEETAALLVVATYFSGRGSPRDKNPHETRILRAARRFLHDKEIYPGWDGRSSSALPLGADYRSRYAEVKFDDDEAAITDLARAHADMFKTLRPMALYYVERIPRDLIEESKRRREKYQAEKMANELREREKAKIREEEERKEGAERAKERKRFQEYFAKMKEAHPRFGDWQGLKDEELKRLVWEKPTIELAKEFGISDVAIGKRCVARGIAKPPRGYWAKKQSKRVREER